MLAWPRPCRAVQSGVVGGGWLTHHDSEGLSVALVVLSLVNKPWGQILMMVVLRVSTHSPPLSGSVGLYWEIMWAWPQVKAGSGVVLHTCLILGKCIGVPISFLAQTGWSVSEIGRLSAATVNRVIFTGILPLPVSMLGVNVPC